MLNEKTDLRKISLILFLVLLFTIPFNNGSTSQVSEASSGITFSPLDADLEIRQFLEGKAGMSAYVKLGYGINLNEVRTAFSDISFETEDYIVGSVTLGPKLFIHRNGLVVFYYMKDTPTSTMFDIKNFDGNDIDNILENAMNELGTILNKDMNTYGIKYYHFDHPDAKRLLTIADRDTCYVTIPEGIQVLDASISAYHAAKNNYVSNNVDLECFSINNKNSIYEHKPYLNHLESIKINEITVYSIDVKTGADLRNQLQYVVCLIYK